MNETKFEAGWEKKAALVFPIGFGACEIIRVKNEHGMPVGVVVSLSGAENVPGECCQMTDLQDGKFVYFMPVGGDLEAISNGMMAVARAFASMATEIMSVKRQRDALSRNESPGIPVENPAS